MLRAYFSCAEDYSFAELFCGWSINAQTLVSSGRLEAVAALLFDEHGRSRGSLRWQIGVHDLSCLEGDEEIVLGLDIGAPREGLELAQLNEHIKRVKAEVKKLGDELQPFDIKAPPRFHILAQGPLCKASLVRGVWMERDLVFDDSYDRMDVPYWYEWDSHSFDWHQISHGQNQDDVSEGVFGVKLGQAGPWQSPMIKSLELPKRLDTALEKASKARQLEGARYHLIYQYGN